MTESACVSVQIPAAPRGYDILIEPGVLSRLAEPITSVLEACRKILLVTDMTVEGLYAEQVRAQLDAAGYAVSMYVIPDGELSKTLESAQNIYAAALSIGLTRKDAILALGGGVVGDLAGFCAATYYRGMPFVQLPTTLLAQVDSSVGGKVAVNFETVKNGIGAFYQPQMVLIDPEVLQTLPERQIKAGLAEVLKYGLIEGTCGHHLSESFFQFLEQQSDNLTDVYVPMIERCCQIKAAIVVQDETERTGLRAHLNLGHTFAHAYEAITGYTELLHGEAVSIGMVKACRLSERLGIFPGGETIKVLKLAAKLGLLTAPPNVDSDELIDLMKQDKKVETGAFRFVLPHQEIGHVVIRDDVANEHVMAVLSESSD